MASLIQWAWVWVDSGSWWWTGRPGMLQCMGLQRVKHDWVTELNWTFVETVAMIKKCCKSWLWKIVLRWTLQYIYLLEIRFSPGICTREVLLRWYGNSVLLLKELPYCSPYWLYQFTRPLTVQEGSLFSTLSPWIIVCRICDDSCSDWCEIRPHCSFDFHFSNN